MRNSIIILSLIFICSCSNKTITGLYGDCSKHCFVYTKILLKENNEFEYFQFYDVGGETTVKGKWNKINDTIILNTYEQQEDRISDIIESTDLSDSIRFEILNDRGDIFLDSPNSDTLNLGYRQIGATKRFNIKRFKIIIYSDPKLRPIEYKVLNINTNHFAIKTRDLKTSLFLKNKKYIVKSNKLILISESTGQATQSFYFKR